MNLPFHGIFLTTRFPLAPQGRYLDIGRTMATALPQQCLPLSIVCGTSDGIMAMRYEYMAYKSAITHRI